MLCYNQESKSRILPFLYSIILHLLIITFLLFINNKNKFYYFNPVNNGAIFIHVVEIKKNQNNIQNNYSNNNIKNSYYKSKEILEIKHTKPPNPIINEKKQRYTGSGGSGKQASKILNIGDEYNDLFDYKPILYPRESLVLKQEGAVIIRVLVNQSGNIIDTEVYNSSGYKLLDQAALSAVKTWTLKKIIKEKIFIELKINFIIK